MQSQKIILNQSGIISRIHIYLTKSDRKISENDLKWADLVFVMETGHRAKIWGLYRHLELPSVEVLNIANSWTTNLLKY